MLFILSSDCLNSSFKLLAAARNSQTLPFRKLPMFAENGLLRAFSVFCTKVPSFESSADRAVSVFTTNSSTELQSKATTHIWTCCKPRKNPCDELIRFLAITAHLSTHFGPTVFFHIDSNSDSVYTLRLAECATVQLSYTGSFDSHFRIWWRMKEGMQNKLILSMELRLGAASEIKNILKTQSLKQIVIAIHQSSVLLIHNLEMQMNNWGVFIWYVFMTKKVQSLSSFKSTEISVIVIKCCKIWSFLQVNTSNKSRPSICWEKNELWVKDVANYWWDEEQLLAFSFWHFVSDGSAFKVALDGQTGLTKAMSHCSSHSSVGQR